MAFADCRVKFAEAGGDADRRLAKLEAGWQDGISLGVECRSREYLVGLRSDGFVKCRDVRRKCDEDRWCTEAALTLKGVPWQPSPRAAHCSAATRP